MPFVQMFYGQPGTLWQDDLGEAHTIHQGEEGEQGDPLMPLLFSLGQHSKLEAVNSRLQEDDRLMALFDDVYLVNPRPDSVCIHTQDHTSRQCNIKILGTPLGHHNYVQNHLERVADEHQRFLDMLLSVPNLQSSWLLPLHCASATNYLLRTVCPDSVRGVAEAHDRGLWECVCVVEHHSHPGTVDTGHGHPSTVFGRIGSSKCRPNEPFGLLDQLGRFLANDQCSSSGSCRHDHQTVEWASGDSMSECSFEDRS